MGNAPNKDKMRHASGDDIGPSMVPPVFDMMDESSEFPSGSFKGLGGGDMAPEGRVRASTITSQSDLGPKKLPTVFKWDGGGKQVCLSGSFDNWKSKIPLVRSHGDFYTIVDLPEGTHEYKFLVDGNWTLQKGEPVVDSDVGSKNNQVTVRTSDFEVFEALAMDSNSTGKPENSVSGSPPGDYGQHIPPKNSSSSYHQSNGPPILPPHLLQVILNKEIPLHCEPTLLPEPNHVMLNHLYALSIKDGVMVLSATHRYRKKYVTTLLYKPIPSD